MTGVGQRRRVGISTYALMWNLGTGGEVFAVEPKAMGLADVADLAIGLSSEVVQFADNAPLDALSRTERDELVTHLHEAGVAVEIGSRGLERAHLLRQLELAQEVGSPVLRLVTDVRELAPARPAQIVSALAPLQNAFESAGVVLALENYDRLATRDLTRVVDELGPWVGICLDTVNSFGALEGPAAVLDTLAPRAVNVHVKDFVVKRAPHAMGFLIEGHPAGEGMLDLPALLAGLPADASISLILEQWPPPQHTLAATRALELDWLVRSLTTLRSIMRPASAEKVS